MTCRYPCPACANLGCAQPDESLPARIYLRQDTVGALQCSIHGTRDTVEWACSPSSPTYSVPFALEQPASEVAPTPTCRCRELRSALLGLCRAARGEQKAAAQVANLPRDASYQDRANALCDLSDSDKSLRSSIRHARRLLRDTKQEKRDRSASSDETLTALRLLACAAKRYRDSENALTLVMDEMAFFDDGSNPEFTAALEEQAEALRVLSEALGVAAKNKARASSALNRDTKSIEQSHARLSDIVAKNFGTLSSESPLLVLEREVPLLSKRHSDALSALNRIIDAWQAFDCKTAPHASSDSEFELHEVLRSVAREFGVDENGGISK